MQPPYIIVQGLRYYVRKNVKCALLAVVGERKSS